MQRVAFFIIITMALIWPSQLLADKGRKNSPMVYSKEQPAIGQRATFSPAERNLIRAQLLGQKRTSSQQKQKGLPQVLQKKNERGRDLPSDWQEKIAVGQSLDYHVYRRGVRLPETLLQRLPQPPKGTGILMIEDKIIRINETTRTILDLFDLIPVR